ncbi:MAG: FKBP-type peptidyl-prolyl cis-trans isomerase [Gammaproteobacteria bacterium]|nr:FKBP-type peptidyl-prolyl cis-trans isomerase [Gammaproteobacteria bacterium]
MYSKTKVFLSAFLLGFFMQIAHAGHGSTSEVAIQEVKIGQGDAASSFSIVDVHYTGKLEDGTVFDSSIKRNKPFQFTLGAGQVIPGWEMGIKGMQAGGKRILTIPADLAYGKQGAGGVIPPNATLIFEVELISVTPAPFTSIDNAQLVTKMEKGIKLIDIRRADEWQQTGIVKGSIKSTAFNGQGQFQQSFLDMLKKTVQPDEEFAIICRTGNRTSNLSNWLATKGGYKNVLNVRDGIVSWMEEGRPTSKAN